VAAEWSDCFISYTQSQYEVVTCTSTAFQLERIELSGKRGSECTVVRVLTEDEKRAGGDGEMEGNRNGNKNEGK
jgi:hypothetical protein